MSVPEYNSHEIFKIFVKTLVASSVGETLSLPLNSIKVMLQLQGENCKCFGGVVLIRPCHYTNMWDAIRSIVKKHGIKSLLTNSLDSMYGRQLLHNSIMALTNHPIKVLYYQQFRRFNYPCTFEDFSVQLPTNLTVCAMSVVICQPTTVIKGRAQSDEPVTRKKFKYLAKKIYQEEGIKGFWRATLPVYLRMSIYTILSTYFVPKLKTEAKQRGFWSYFWRGVITVGLMDALFIVLGNPLDVMRIRIINAMPKYGGLYDCISWTLKHEGFGAFYKGFGASYCSCFIYDICFCTLFYKVF